MYIGGRIETLFLPEDNDLEAYLYEEIVPGTHLMVYLLSYLLFNKYQMFIPSYRETKNRLADMNWDTCRQNLSNWVDKGTVQLNKLISTLKDVALQAGSNVNADEIWESYRTHNGHKKTYMWCLVNKKAGIIDRYRSSLLSCSCPGQVQESFGSRL
nr:transposase [Jilunia laotingensis]